MPRRASLGTWLYFSCTALDIIFMSQRASTCRRARQSRPTWSAPAPHPTGSWPQPAGDNVLAIVPSHARLADSLTPPSPPASHLRPPSPPLPRSPLAPRGNATPFPPPRPWWLGLLPAASLSQEGARARGRRRRRRGCHRQASGVFTTPSLQPQGPSNPPQPPERSPLSGFLPPRRTVRSAARHPARPVSPPRHHHPLARPTHTALPSHWHRPAHSTTRAGASRHSRLPASVTARHGHTTFYADWLSPILALFCAFKNLKNKNTV